MNRTPIFDSKAETHLYKTLESRWSQHVHIYPQLPVRKVLGYEKLTKHPMLTEPQKSYLLKTEFDFVVCHKSTFAPILAIEFDGIGNGFSSDGQYVTKTVPLFDPNRKLKLDTKLKACELFFFPLVIISWEEIDVLIGEIESISLLDGIVSQVLVNTMMPQKIEQNRKHLEQIAENDETNEAVQDFIDGLYVELNSEFNPFAQFVNKNFGNIRPETMGFMNIETVNGYIGQNFFLTTKVPGEAGETIIEKVEVDVVMREVNCGGVMSFEILNDIGEFLLFVKALQILELHEIAKHY